MPLCSLASLDHNDANHALQHLCQCVKEGIGWKIGLVNALIHMVNIFLEGCLRSQRGCGRQGLRCWHLNTLLMRLFAQKQTPEHPLAGAQGLLG